MDGAGVRVVGVVGSKGIVDGGVAGSETKILCMHVEFLTPYVRGIY